MAGKKKYVIREERNLIKNTPYWIIKHMGLRTHDDCLLMHINDSSLLAPIAQIMEAQNFKCYNPEKINLSVLGEIPSDIEVKKCSHSSFPKNVYVFKSQKDGKLLLSVFNEDLLYPIKKVLCSEQKEWDRVHLPNQNDEDLER